MHRLGAVPAALAIALGGVASCDDGDATSDGGGGASSTSTSAATGGATATASTSVTTSVTTTTSGAGGASSGCLTDLSAGHKEVVCAGGIAYEVEIPTACTQGACGLIVDLHGYTMTGDSEDENTGMRALGQQAGYVVVQPTAPKDNFQQPSWDQPIHAPLVHAFLVALAADLPIDAARIHAMGFSQGGGMTLRLLCDHADFFASGAPIGAIAGCEFSGQNTPTEEVDILQVHGRTDAVVSFTGVAVPQRDAALAAWPFGAPSVLEDDGAHKATRWTTTGGIDFEFWEHDYQTSDQVVFVGIAGHCVPGGTDFDGIPAGYSCENVNTFVFGQLAMQFFQAHPKN